MRGFDPVTAVALHEEQGLEIAGTHRDHEATALGELVAKFLGDGRGRGRDDDPVVGSTGTIAQAAVGNLDPDALTKAQVIQPRAGLAGELGMAFQTEDLGAERCEHGGLVARPGAELKDAFAGTDREQLRHARDHVRLADRLTGIDPDGRVRVGPPPIDLAQEGLAWDGAHRLEHALVTDAPGHELAFDHPCALTGHLVRADHPVAVPRYGLGDAAALGAAEALADADADGPADAESDGLADAEADAPADAAADADGTVDPEALADADAEAEADGAIDADAEAPAEAETLVEGAALGSPVITPPLPSRKPFSRIATKTATATTTKTFETLSVT